MVPVGLRLGVASALLLLAAGCGQQQAAQARWEELQFKVALRSEPYRAGDAATGGSFEDLLVIALPIRVADGPGEAHAIADGVWLHLAWDDLAVESRPRPALVFEGFRCRVENRFVSPYGTWWQDGGWQDRGRVNIAQDWDRLLTPVGIDPTGEDERILCRMWRWVRPSSRPDIPVGTEGSVARPDAGKAQRSAAALARSR